MHRILFSIVRRFDMFITNSFNHIHDPILHMKCSLNLFVKNSDNVVHATYILSSKKFDLNTRLLIVEPFVYVIY